MMMKHKKFELVIKVIERVDTQYSGGYTKSNYKIVSIKPESYTVTKGVRRDIESICDKDYIEQDWEIIDG